MEKKINPAYFIKTKEGNSKDIGKFEYPDYIDFNNKIGSLLIEWSKTKEDFRVGGSERHIFFDIQHTWHSVDNLFEYEQFFPLRDFILEKVSSSTRFESMWAIIAKKHSKGIRHSHKGTHSYCYYVSNGHNDEKITGKMLLETPNEIEVIEPQDGFLFIFPATIKHTIYEYLGENLRIVIAGNLIK